MQQAQLSDAEAYAV